MKKISKLGFVLFASLFLLTTACKKSPSTKIHNSWNLTEVELAEADSVTIAQMLNEGVVYTFSKGGEFTSTIGGTKSAGTFEINKEGTQITTTEDGITSTYSVVLSDTELQLSEGSDVMKFTVKK